MIGRIPGPPILLKHQIESLNCRGVGFSDDRIRTTCPRDRLHRELPEKASRPQHPDRALQSGLEPVDLRKFIVQRKRSTHHRRNAIMGHHGFGTMRPGTHRNTRFVENHPDIVRMRPLDRKRNDTALIGLGAVNAQPSIRCSRSVAINQQSCSWRATSSASSVPR